MPKLKAPENHHNVSFDGHEYEIDADGHVTVPDEAVKHLEHHGYIQVAVEESVEVKKSKKAKSE